MRIGIITVGMALLAATPAQSATLLRNVTDYNAFVLGNFSSSGSDVEGRLAVGGAANLSSYGVAQTGANLGDTYTLVVGGSLNASNGRLHQGTGLAGSSTLASNFTANIVTASSANPMLDFAGEGARLSALSTSLGGYAANGSAVAQWGGLYLTGTNSGLNVFNITTADLTGKNNFVLNAPAGSIALVNVTGSSASMMNQGFSLQGIDRSRVLFNFVDGASLSLGGIGINASILAPRSSVNFNNGQLNGTLIAANFTGNGQINYAPYAGGLLTSNASAPVPEPSTWAMLIAGFGALGFALRRRRAPVARLA